LGVSSNNDDYRHWCHLLESNSANTFISQKSKVDWKVRYFRRLAFTSDNQHFGKHF